MNNEGNLPAALKAVVTGRVQGVYYRVFAERHARQLQLQGYVKNLRDLSVEVYAEGSKNQLQQLLERLKEGPPGARVDDMEITWLEPRHNYHGFTVVP
ncbi:MAG: acylphosphatase [Dehalococcoidales bacterium]|nr:acylphosphatase [Dehalococcoidales bacterium]